MLEVLLEVCEKTAALKSLNLSFWQELQSSYSSESFLLLNNMFTKNFKKLTAKKHLIACALPGTEDHINSFQVDVPFPYHLETSENI